MKSLPADILIQIFSQLQFIYKLECRVVCKYWNTIISKYILFQTLLIRPSSGSYKLAEKINNREWQGRQVQHLLIYPDRSSFSPYSLREGERNSASICLKPNLLSGLRSLYINAGLNMAELDLSLEDYQPFRRRIEYLVDLDGSRFTFQLLNLGVCINLTKLVVRVYPVHDFESGQVNPDPPNIVSVLKNAPNLNALTLLGFELRFEHLEQVHDSLVHLRSFVSDFTLGNDTLPAQIAPANTVTQIFIPKLFQNSNFVLPVLDYISQKYPNLEALGFTSLEFGIDWFSLDDFPNIHYTNIAGMFAFHKFENILQRFGPQLKVLDAGYQVDSGFIEFIDRLGCHFEKMTIDRRDMIPLSRSSQSAYIVDLRITNFVNVDVMENLNQFVNLKKLHLSGIPNQVSTADIAGILVNSSNNLESLSLKDFHTDAIRSTGLEFSIKEITLLNCHVKLDLGEFISQHCPKLHYFDFNHCTSKGSISICICIPKHRLSYFRIKNQNQRIDSYWYVTTHDGQYFYHIGANKWAAPPTGHHPDAQLDYAYEAARPVPQVTFYAGIKITLTCYSVDTLVLNNRLAC